MTKSDTALPLTAREWYAEPTAGHAVQFYRSDNALLAPLSEFVSGGIERNETCVVVATLPHMQALDLRLQAKGVDTVNIELSGQFYTLNAAHALAGFYNGGMPDEQQFAATVGAVIAQAAQRNRPIRVYCEMVALLWKEGRKDAVMELECMWDGICAQYDVSLYCAYPQLYFIMDRDKLNDIRSHHSLCLSPAS